MDKMMWYEVDGEIMFGAVEQHIGGYWHTKTDHPAYARIVYPFETKKEAVAYTRGVLELRARSAMEMFHRATEKKKKFLESCK